MDGSFALLFSSFVNWNVGTLCIHCPSAVVVTNMSLRVISLLPSATEILALIGGECLLVGRSHECDFPHSVKSAPVLTSSSLKFETSGQIDTEVKEALTCGAGLYSLDEDLLASLKPDIILTQDLCSVCSVDVGRVHKAILQLNPPPRIVNLNPNSLGDVLSSIVTVGEAVGLGPQARTIRGLLQERVDRAAARGAAAARVYSPRVAFLEWLEPAYVGGHWTPQLISLAGGQHLLNPPAADVSHGAGNSFAVRGEEVAAADPDVLILCPCGLDLEATETEANRVAAAPPGAWLRSLRPAAAPGRAAAVDGNQMFNRPGPRLVEALEWLVWFLHEGGGCGPVPPELEAFPWRPWRLQAFDSQSSPGATPATADVQAAADMLTGGVGAGGWKGPELSPEIEECHRQAVSTGQEMYTDPQTGFMVFTELAMRKRGWCCGRGCRHCPFGHWLVAEPSRRKNPIREATLLRHRSRGEVELLPRDSRLEVVFWSGGKDSYLALLTHQQELSVGPSRRLVLLTTFDAATGIVPEQGIPMIRITDQARALGLDLMAVPLPSGPLGRIPDAAGAGGYLEGVAAALQRLQSELGCPDRPRSEITLVFGDLHLADIRTWREQCLGAGGLGYTCAFPLFGQAYPALLDSLFPAGNGAEAGVQVRVSACRRDWAEAGRLRVGQAFTRQLAEQLAAAGLDAMGEGGEFHTELVLPHQ